jgi:hypothetical protein
MSQQCKRVLFHLCGIVSTVWQANHWTARHCHYRPLCGTKVNLNGTEEEEQVKLGRRSKSGTLGAPLAYKPTLTYKPRAYIPINTVCTRDRRSHASATNCYLGIDMPCFGLADTTGNKMAQRVIVDACGDILCLQAARRPWVAG